MFKKEILFFVPKAIGLLLISAIVSPFTVGANTLDTASERVPTEQLQEGIKSRDGRWFEVEMIVFKRTDNIELREQFSQNVKPLTSIRQWDLIRDLLKPDISLFLQGLPECHQDKNPLADLENNTQVSPAQFFENMMHYQTLINQKWQFTNELCLMPNESLTGYWQLVNDLPNIDDQEYKQVPLTQIPQRIVAGDHDDFHNIYVIGEQNLQLVDHFNKLKQHPHTEPMLHIGWRQPGLSKRNSRPVYLVAGQNYSERFRYDGSEIILEDNAEITNVATNSQTATISAAPDLEADAKDNVKNFMKRLQSGAVVDFKNSTLIYPKQDELPDETWEIDGFLQVHLDHYLYLDGQFNFRELSKETLDPEQFLAQLTKDKALESAELEQKNRIEQTDALESVQNNVQQQTDSEQSLTELTSSNDKLVTINYLKTYNFKQTRKLYSGDLHYLDHPKMGILIQIRKYRH